MLGLIDLNDSPEILSPKILVVLHQEHSTPGRIGRLLRQKGCELDIRRPRFGDPLPRSLADHAGAIVFGGPMSANDEDDFVKAEIDWINVPLKEKKPFLGICLGAQMLARTLGQRVYVHPEGRVEIGYYPIRPTEHGRALCSARFPDHVYHWHREGFGLPQGALLLAEGGDFEVQAVRFGATAYGFQFHPEVTYAMMCRWTSKGAERLTAPGAWARDHHLEGWFLHDSKVASWTENFLDCWMAGARTDCPCAA
jgi:GMP synthase (glutamine-hydrolysing)